ncbi:hypothetical protein CTA2_2408 [Colletotrichum tanaceti]|uniref:Uncharacterized protein n=1 Tax=Colletotrichum tanaceti TaxID=1306861 RepID=A0A4U6XWD5_9PEZI|nr:hypothetical protein CTA2_2408 [Colletotrichum tanaceti]TKW60268.1 hypothetical protein CTA1_4755 [Colletotrichum tanaceti]
MASNFTKRGRSSPNDRLAFLALTHTIDQWSCQYPHLADELLGDTDQQLLSELYVAHLVPAARSFWWNDDNYHRAMGQLLKEKYPVVKVVAWKNSGPKASNLLQTWREDAALLYTDLIGAGRDDNVPSSEADEEVDEETDSTPNVSHSHAAELDEAEFDEQVEKYTVAVTKPDIKRKASKTLSRVEKPKKARERSVYDEESSEDDTFEMRHRAKMGRKFSTLKPAATALMTPPQSDNSTLTIVIDSDSENEDLAATSRLESDRSVYDESSEDDIFEIRRRPEMRRTFSTHRPAAAALMTPPQSGESNFTIVTTSNSEDGDVTATTSRLATGQPNGPVAASDPTPLSLTPVQTVVSIEPAEELTRKHKCLTAIRETIDRVAESYDTFLPQERSEASHQLKKLELKLERLSKTAKRLKEAIES